MSALRSLAFCGVFYLGTLVLLVPALLVLIKGALAQRGGAGGTAT